jgi:hypothetical protein
MTPFIVRFPQLLTIEGAKEMSDTSAILYQELVGPENKPRFISAE